MKPIPSMLVTCNRFWDGIQSEPVGLGRTGATLGIAEFWRASLCLFCVCACRCLLCWQQSALASGTRTCATAALSRLSLRSRSQSPPSSRRWRCAFRMQTFGITASSTSNEEVVFFLSWRQTVVVGWVGYAESRWLALGEGGQEIMVVWDWQIASAV